MVTCYVNGILQSGGFRNLERGVHTCPKIFGLPGPLLVMLEVGAECLEATLGLVKRLEISKELICECVIVPDCNHLMGSCSYVCKNTLLAAKGGVPLPPPPPPKSATDASKTAQDK